MGRVLKAEEFRLITYRKPIKFCKCKSNKTKAVFKNMLKSNKILKRIMQLIHVCGMNWGDSVRQPYHTT